jgi:regulator of sigma E protease
MNNFLISVGSIVIVLGVMVLVHEWGHFIVARMCGVRVDVFSVGMGPRIWGYHRGATDYRLSALPIGGYVRMAGENPTDQRTGAPDEFLSKKRWQRALIIMAGPTMNIVMALVIATGLMMSGKGLPAYLKNQPEVSAVDKGSPAAQAGIQSGDVIVAVKGQPVKTWDDVIWQSFFVMPNSTLPIEVERGSRRIALSVQTSPDSDHDDLFGYPVVKTFVGDVQKGQPGALAGLEKGDQIVAVNENRAVSPNMVATSTEDSAGKPVQMTIERKGQTLNVVVHPAYGVLQGGPKGQKVWHVGVSLDAPITYTATTMGQAIRGGVRYNVLMTSAIVDTVLKLIEHKARLKQLSGPVGIAQASGQAAREGLLDFLNFMAIISLNLGIVNLLPIPILDGWHILTLAVEGTMRRDLSMAVKERALQVGLVFLLLLILIVTYNDVFKLVIPSH